MILLYDTHAQKPDQLLYLMHVNMLIKRLTLSLKTSVGIGLSVPGAGAWLTMEGNGWGSELRSGKLRPIIVPHYRPPPVPAAAQHQQWSTPGDFNPFTAFRL